jgi:hypothetical protein
VLAKEQKARESLITKEESEKAIYIDFEGFQDKSPTLIGCWCDGSFSQIVFDPVLKPAAKAKGLSVREAKQATEDLLRWATAQNRRIIAYTQHEKRLASSYFGVDLSPVYADARMIAKKWLAHLKKRHVNWKEEYPHWDIEYGLKDFFELTGYDRPSYLGKQKSTKRIRDVTNMLVKRNCHYERLTHTTKGKWTKLLKHNEHDVIGMRYVIEKTLSDYMPR